MDKKFDNSQFLLRVYMPIKNTATHKDKILTYPSFPHKDRLGAEHQFDYMVNNLLIRKLNNSYKTALFIERQSNRIIHKLVRGTQIF